MRFGLDLEFLPKHTNEALSSLKSNGKIEMVDEKGNVPRGFCLDDKKRTIYIKKRG
jgi:hypothetical protein